MSSLDLSMLSRYNYYTGIFFRGYTFGSGDAIVKGGRYDNLLQHFGKNAPSIRFVVVVDELLSALTHQKLLPEHLSEVIDIYFDASNQETMIKEAIELRKQGKQVALHLTK